jgi:hypothetical protein
MEHPWRYYEKSVGMWVVETGRSVHSFPLKTEGLDLESVKREYFHYFDGAMRALGGLFTVTSVEYPPGEPIMESPAPLDLREAKEKLYSAWKEDIKKCSVWAPGAILRGITDVAVKADDRVSNAQLPGILSAMFSAVPGSDRYALALVTNCDIWLVKAISGADNPVGTANSPWLKYALHRLEDALDGRVVHYATEYEGVKVQEDGFG